MMHGQRNIKLSLLIVYDTQNGYIFTAFVKYPSVLSRLYISRTVILLLLFFHK